MQPQSSNEIPKLNLPPPLPEANTEGSGTGNLATSPETLPSAEAANLQKQPSQGAPPSSTIDFTALAGLKDNSAQTTTSASTNIAVDAPAIADDNDLIEKEWVNKAKQIVEDNRGNPYQQSKDMTLFKADYMQKRYSKTIKVGE